jgi:hypothetical protein
VLVSEVGAGAGACAFMRVPKCRHYQKCLPYPFDTHHTFLTQTMFIEKN